MEIPRYIVVWSAFPIPRIRVLSLQEEWIPLEVKEYPFPGKEFSSEEGHRFKVIIVLQDGGPPSFMGDILLVPRLPSLIPAELESIINAVVDKFNNVSSPWGFNKWLFLTKEGENKFRVSAYDLKDRAEESLREFTNLEQALGFVFGERGRRPYRDFHARGFSSS